MFERFSDRARRVVTLSQEEARLLKHDYIGTEHLLLGLLHEAEGIAGKVLLARGVDLEQLRRWVEETVGQGSRSPAGHIPFTPRAKKVLELGLREALQLGHNYVGTEHILLGLIREGEGVAAQVLVGKAGLSLSGIRVDIIDMVSGRRSPESPESPEASEMADDPESVSAFLDVLRRKAKDYGVQRERLSTVTSLLKAASDLMEDPAPSRHTVCDVAGCVVMSINTPVPGGVPVMRGVHVHPDEADPPIATIDAAASALKESFLSPE